MPHCFSKGRVHCTILVYRVGQWRGHPVIFLFNCAAHAGAASVDSCTGPLRVPTSAAHCVIALPRGTSTSASAAGLSRRALRRHSYSWCAATPASSANARALKPDAAQRASSRLRLSCSITCRPRTNTNALSSLIRRTLHGRRFADYAVARYTLTVVGPAVIGMAGGGEWKSAVNGLGAVREEGRIIERNGRFHGPPA